MSVRFATLVVALSLAPLSGGCAGSPAANQQLTQHPDAPFLARAHSHNNYEQRRPLHGALERGFASIEVDVVLQDGTLFVAHGPEEVRPGVTLERLYLDPLRSFVERNGGTVYGPNRPPLQLLVDVKTDAEETYRALDRTLRAYPELFASWTPDGVRPGPVFAVLSGNRAVDLIARQEIRYAAVDGRATEDRTHLTVDAMPLVSVDWEKLGPTDPAERFFVAERLVEELHAEGRKVRFWATPDREDVWRSLVAMGVDYIGTDEVDRLDRFLQRTDAEPVAIN